MKSPAAELAATGRSAFRACYLSIRELSRQIVLHPNPAQQAATTLPGHSDKTRHIVTLSNTAIYVNSSDVNFSGRIPVSGRKVNRWQ
jgi:hypothetical protein